MVYSHRIHASDIRVIDDTQQTVILSAPAQRIISLAPHVTELLFSVSAGAQIVGAVSYSDYPEAAKSIPRVGGYTRFDLEKILRLQPDLIIAWDSGNPRSQLDYLQTLNIPVFYSNPTTLSGIADSLRRFGQLTGHAQVGAKLARTFSDQIDGLQRRYAHRKNIRVFYEVWRQPLLTVNGTHLISHVIDLCGGENIYHELPSLTPTVSLESTLIRQPEVLLTSVTPEQIADWRAVWLAFPHLPAIRKQLLFNINPDHLQRPTYRILHGIKAVCDSLDQARAAI